MTNDEIDFSEALEDYLDDYNSPEVGDIRTGVIVDISQEGIIVDLGLKRDGFVPASDLSKLSESERESLEVDQEISVYVVSTGDSLQISLHRAYLNQDWIQAKELLDEGTIVEGEVVGYNRGGALVEFGRLRGFIPLSQLSDFRPGMQDRDKQRMLSKLRGEQLPLKIIEVDRRRRRLVMSNRDAQREWDSARRAERLETLSAGDVVQGRISSIRDFGAFVDIGDSLEGLVHVSELAWYRIGNPNEVVSVGDELDVYILKVDKEQQRISLSRKRLLPDPWSLVPEKYQVDQLVEGTITRIVNYGAFVEIEPGIEGLLHISKLARGEVENPNSVVREGENHLLRIISIDTNRQRIGLSLRAVTQQEQIDWMMDQEEEEEEAEEAEAIEETVIEETVEEETTAEAEVEETTAEAGEEAEETAAVKEIEPEATVEAEAEEEVEASEEDDAEAEETTAVEEIEPEATVEVEAEEEVEANEEEAENEVVTEEAEQSSEEEGSEEQATAELEEDDAEETAESEETKEAENEEESSEEEPKTE